MADFLGSEISKIDWKNQSYDEFCDILEDINGREIKRNYDKRRSNKISSAALP